MCISPPKVRSPAVPNLAKADQNAANAVSSRLRAGAVKTLLGDRTGDSKPPTVLRQMLGGP